MTVLSTLVDAEFGLPEASVDFPAAMEAVTVPSCVRPETERVNVRLSPLGLATSTIVAPAVPPRVTSEASKPMTASLKMAVNSTGPMVAGSACSAACSTVTVGGRSTMTVLSTLVDAKFGFPEASVALPAAMEAVTVPSCVMPETKMVNVRLSPLGLVTFTIVALAVPPSVT